MIDAGAKKLEEKDIPEVWPQVRRAILGCAGFAQLPISAPDLKLAEKTLIDWVKAPENVRYPRKSSTTRWCSASPGPTR